MLAKDKETCFQVFEAHYNGNISIPSISPQIVFTSTAARTSSTQHGPGLFPSHQEKEIKHLSESVAAASIVRARGEVMPCTFSSVQLWLIEIYLRNSGIVDNFVSELLSTGKNMMNPFF